MSDYIGATAMPLEPQLPGIAVSDPLLSYFLQFFQAVANAYCSAAWQVVQPGPTSVPVRTIFAHDPNELSFDEKDLPGLFLWRDRQDDYKDVTIDSPVDYGTLILLWVPPIMADQGRRRIRNPFVKGLFNVLQDAFERARDPAWYLSGDDYPQNSGVPAIDAANCRELGSVLPHWASFRRAQLRSWKRVQVDISYGPQSGLPPRKYEAYALSIYIEEQLMRDTAARYPAATSIDQKINVPAEDSLPVSTIVEERFT